MTFNDETRLESELKHSSQHQAIISAQHPHFTHEMEVTWHVLQEGAHNRDVHFSAVLCGQRSPAKNNSYQLLP